MDTITSDQARNSTTAMPDPIKEYAEEWQEEEGDRELEAEMVRLQIQMEREKEERLLRRDRRIEEDDTKFLMDALSVEERERRLERTRLLTAEARKKEEQEWLKNALLQEDAIVTPAASTPSPGDPPPILLRVNPVGAEPWWKEGKMTKKSGGVEERAKSNPAGPTSTTSIPDPEEPSPGKRSEREEMKKPGTSAVPELGIARAGEQCLEQKTAAYAASAPAIGLVKKLEQKKHQEKAAASAAKKRLIMQKNRSILRGESMLSQRDLSSAMVEPSVSTAASQVVSKLVAQFETSDSPIKQPGTHHTSTSTAVGSFRCHLHLPAPVKSKPKAEPAYEKERK